MSLKFKISLWVAALLLTTTGGLTTVLIWSEGRALSDGVAQQQAEMVGGLTDVCRSAIYSQEDLLLTNYLKRLKSTAGLLEALCMDSDRRVLGHTDFARMHTTYGDETASPPRALSAPLRRKISRGGQPVLDVQAPVRVGQENIGAVRIIFSAAALDGELEKSMARARRRILQFSLPFMTAGALGAFLLTALVLRPVHDLMEGARIIGAGKLGHTIPIKEKDELGILAEEFNGMARKLQELDRLKQDFVHSVTHDLKTPLTLINAAIEKSEGAAGRAPEPGRGMLTENFFVIRRESERLRNLITSILEVAQIESGLIINKRPLSLEELADRTLQSFKSIAAQKCVGLELLVESEVPPFPADEGKMERVLQNLVGNAMKFTEKGRIVVSVARRGGAAEIKVSDTGPGIPPEFLGRLFSKFSKGPRAMGRKVEGTGLGLAIVKGLVEAHGGTVAVESIVGVGTTFTLRLPLEAHP